MPGGRRDGEIDCREALPVVLESNIEEVRTARYDTPIADQLSFRRTVRMLRARPGTDLPDYPSDIFDEPSGGGSVRGSAAPVTQRSVECLTRILAVGEQKKAAGELMCQHSLNSIETPCKPKFYL